MAVVISINHFDMKSNFKKGKDFETQVRRYLIDRSHLVERKIHTRLKNVSKDFFGLFDILAVGFQKIRFIQCKVNSVKTDDYHKTRTFIEERCPADITGEMWLYEERVDMVLVNQYYVDKKSGKVMSRKFEIINWLNKVGSR